MQSGSKEGLVGIDIPQAGDDSLVHQGCLDRSLLLGQKLPQEIGGKAPILFKNGNLFHPPPDDLSAQFLF